MTSPEPIHLLLPAKVNLFLEILGRRPDGYHELSTVFQTIGLFDTLEITRARSGIELAVDGADLPEGEGNLVFDAARAFLARHAPEAGVRLRLQKRIPGEAGLGGGSSDAAGTLRGLREMLAPELSEADLLPLAADLGADVPFFLGGPTALGEGRGGRLTPLPAPAPFWLALFCPDFGLSTPRVYRAVREVEDAKRHSPAPLLAALREGADIRPFLFNRLEAAACLADDRVAGLRAALAKDLLPGEVLLLSGSGSTFFALTDGFERAAELVRCWKPRGRALAVQTLS